MIINILYFINIVIILYVLYKRYYRLIYILQLEKYKFDRFTHWVFVNVRNKSLYLPLTLSIINFIMITWIEYSYLFLTISLLLNLFYLPFIRHKEQKVKFRFTYRIRRLLVTSFVFSVGLYVVTRLITSNFYAEFELTYVYMVVLNFLIYDVLFFSFYLNKPIEKYIQNTFIKQAKNTLTEQQIDVIGITGSYGKTSTKMIVSSILNKDFFVCRTPKSYNTPMGISITVNNNLRNIDEILVCEMGATKTGDIKELTDIVHPKIGILTEIGPQHLETFLNMSNIIKTKFELIESLPTTGLAILNYDNRFIRGYRIQNKVKVIKYGIQSDDLDYKAINIKYGTFGSTFEVVFPNDERHLFKTKLLGKHNVYNILASIVVADYYQIDITKLKNYIANIEAIDNRLQLKKFDYFTIIDDAFNSNEIGFRNAVDILNHFNSKKIIITPGIIELGKEQYNINYKLAESIANVCDYVVLVGKKQTNAIYEGLIEKGYPRDNIYITNSFNDGYKTVMSKFKENFTLLIENDLPDNYTEE